MTERIDVNVNHLSSAYIDLPDVDVNPPVKEQSIPKKIAIRWKGIPKVYHVYKVPPPGQFSWPRIAEDLACGWMRGTGEYHNDHPLYEWTPPRVAGCDDV